MTRPTIDEGTGSSEHTCSTAGCSEANQAVARPRAQIGLLTAENILGAEPRWNVWRVNQDAQYHELGEDRTLAMSERLVPTAPGSSPSG